MTARTVDPEFSLRLIKSTFLLETGINISLMFCLETVMVDTSLLADNYRREAIDHLRNLLASNEIAETAAERINDFYRKTFGESPVHLDSILSILDGPLSFDVGFYFAVLDPDLRSEIRIKCLDAVSRYKGTLTDVQARNLLEIVFRTCDEILFRDKRFSVLLPQEKRAELKRDFHEYLKRYKDSSKEEIQSRKVKVNIAYDAEAGASLPVGIEEKAIRDWRDFCRYNYLSDRFSIFPDLLEHDILSLTAHESLFLPRRAVISRPLENKVVEVVDGVRYCRERLGRKSPKLLNLNGPRGMGLSAFARMLTVTLASAYSRRRSHLIPLYIDLRGKALSDLSNLSNLIDNEILRRNEELTGAWQTSPTVLVFDNFDRLPFEDEQERERYLSSFLHLALVLRDGGVVVVTDTPMDTRKVGVDIELVSLLRFDMGNINDWFKTWPAALKKPPLSPERLSPELLDVLALPLNLWLALNFVSEDIRRTPSMGLADFSEHLVRRAAKHMAEILLLAERIAVDPKRIIEFCKELAWRNYVARKPVSESDCAEILSAVRLQLSPQTFAKTLAAKLVDVRGGRKSVFRFEVPGEIASSWLIADRFVEKVRKKNFLALLGRPLNERIFDITVELVKKIQGADGEPREEVLRRIRDTLRHWFRYEAVAVLPKRLSKQGVALSDFDAFPDFRLVCFLLWSEITRVLGDNRPLSLPPYSLSRLIKVLQNNPSPERLDFKRYLAGLNLRGMIFADVDMEGADFGGCDLSEAKFMRCNLEKCAFSEANLVGAVFENCCAREADFSDANLSGCTMGYCDLSDSIFRESRFDASRLHYASFRGVYLVGASMNKCSCAMADFTGANLTGCELTESSFDRVDFTRAKMTGANLDESSFYGCLFLETNMTIASARKSLFKGSAMNSTCLAGLNGQELKFTNVSGVSVDLEEALLHKAAFTDCRLQGANLRKANLTAARLTGTDLRESDFTAVNLTMTDLSHSMLEKAVGLGTIERAEGADLTGCTGISYLERGRLRKLGAHDSPDTGIYPK